MVNRITRRRKTIRKYKMKGGTCGCNKPALYGGNGAASFPVSSSPSQFTYDTNKYVDDPSRPPIGDLSSRNPVPTQSGGKQNKKRSKRNNSKSKNNRNKKNKTVRFSKKHMKGGYNAVDSFGTTSGAFGAQNLLKMAPYVNSEVNDQPVLKMYGNHNSPLV